MLREALDYPTSGDHGSRAVLTGGGLLLLTAVAGGLGVVLFPLLGVALVAQLAVRGYYVRALRRAVGRPGAEAPAFDEWGDLLVDGLKAVIVLVGYALPAVVLLVVAVGGQLASAVGSPGAALAAVRTLTGFSVLFLLLYTLAAAYLLPAAVVNMAYTGQLRDAFRLRTVVGGASTEDYAVGWVISLVVQLVALPVVVLLEFVLVGFLLQFLVGVAVRYIWGRSFGAALGLDPLPLGDDRAGPDADRPSTGGAAGVPGGDTAGRHGPEVDAPAGTAGTAGSGDGPPAVNGPAGPAGGEATTPGSGEAASGGGSRGDADTGAGNRDSDDAEGSGDGDDDWRNDDGERDPLADEAERHRGGDG